MRSRVATLAYADREALGQISTTAYVTLADHKLALRTRQERRHEPAGGVEPTSLELVSEEAVLRDLFPQSYGRLSPSRTEGVAQPVQLAPEFTEQAQAIHMPKRSVSERPFATLASLVVHFPWADTSLWNAEIAQMVAQTIRGALQAIAALHAQDRDELESVQTSLLFATRNCPAFSPEQKAYIEGKMEVRHSLPCSFDAHSRMSLGSPRLPAASARPVRPSGTRRSGSSIQVRLSCRFRLITSFRISPRRHRRTWLPLVQVVRSSASIRTPSYLRSQSTPAIRPDSSAPRSSSSIDKSLRQHLITLL